MNAVTFSPDGRLLASASWDNTVRLWSVADRRQVGPPLYGHADLGGASSVSFSPDGHLLASSGSDKTVRLWDPATQRPVGEPLPLPDRVNAVAFSPDGHGLASGDDGADVRLWEPLWELGDACETVVPYVTRAQVTTFMPANREPSCRYRA